MVNLNQADIEALQTLKGIGQVTAEKIVNYRAEKEGFGSVEELTNVSGIGEKSLEQLKENLTVEKTSKTAKVEIAFNPQAYDLPELEEVHVVGEMNDWNPADKSYSLKKENGIWKNKFDLKEGTEYKIIYDAVSWDRGNDIGNFDGSNFEV